MADCGNGPRNCNLFPGGGGGGGGGGERGAGGTPLYKPDVNEISNLFPFSFSIPCVTSLANRVLEFEWLTVTVAL